MSQIGEIIGFRNGSGVTLTHFKMHVFNQYSLSGATSGITIAGVTSSSGSTANKLYGPKAVVLDQYDYVYILDTGNKRVQRWAPGATSGVTIISSTSWNNPTGMRLGPSGSLVLADTNNHRVISFPISCRE